jgi:hypothetical protein
MSMDVSSLGSPEWTLTEYIWSEDDESLGPALDKLEAKGSSLWN